MDRYCRAIERARGVPVPGYAPDPDPECRGLVLCGGGDLAPVLFGQESRGSHPPDPIRDRAEWVLLNAFLAAGKPVLGICRGMQVLNVFLGGTLLQDLGEARRPLHQGAEDVFHSVQTAPGSLLARFLGPEALVNSAHHQALDRLGGDLWATAWASDGTVEGVEHRTRPALGVQFHPERLPGGAGDRLFQWLTAGAGNKRISPDCLHAPPQGRKRQAPNT